MKSLAVRGCCLDARGAFAEEESCEGLQQKAPETKPSSCVVSPVNLVKVEKFSLLLDN